MNGPLWIGLAAWAIVIATAAAAFLFGQLARDTVHRYPPGHLPSTVRTGVAVSISGPLLVVVVGLVVALLTGAWVAVSIGTFVGVVVVTGLGWFLAPR